MHYMVIYTIIWYILYILSQLINMSRKVKEMWLIFNCIRLKRLFDCKSAMCERVLLT